MGDITNYISIENAQGTISFTCLYKPDTLFFWPGTQGLTFRKYEGDRLVYWDNEKYLKELFKALKRGEKTKHTKDLKKMCEKHSLNYTDVVKYLLEIYAEVKRFGLLKKKML